MGTNIGLEMENENVFDRVSDAWAKKLQQLHLYCDLSQKQEPFTKKTPELIPVFKVNI